MSNENREERLIELLGVHGDLVDSTFRNLGMDPPDRDRLVEALRKAASS